MMYIILTSIAALIFFAYVLYACIAVKGIPHSISQTWYTAPFGKGMCVTYILMTFLILPVIFNMEIDHSWMRVFGLLSMLCLEMVALWPDYWTPGILLWHDGFTHVCELMAILWVCLGTHYWWTLPAYLLLWAIPCFATKTWKECFSFWLEMAAFTCFLTATILELCLHL